LGVEEDTRTLSKHKNQEGVWNRVSQTRILGPFVMTLSNVSLFLLLLLRWKESGHFPLSNLYESLIFLSWSLTFLHLMIEIGFYGFFLKELKEKKTESLIFPFNGSSFSSFPERRERKPRKELLSSFIGSIIAPSALFTNAFATFSLPKEMQEASALVPALQSNWLMMHVTVMILSYAALILGSLLSIGFLVVTSNEKPLFDLSSLRVSFSTPRRLESDSTSGTLEVNLPSLSPRSNSIETVLRSVRSEDEDSKTPISYKQKLAKTLDNLSYRVLGLGFPLLTIGILSGSVWANEAWGSYWSWDPKETWALLTWLVFAIYLHTRLNRGWEGRKPAIIASFGFISVWICFLGVNLIGEGLHSYGWLSNS
jgi:cytochrome c-type biogenesis protein CcsB